MNRSIYCRVAGMPPYNSVFPQSNRSRTGPLGAGPEVLTSTHRIEEISASHHETITNIDSQGQIRSEIRDIQLLQYFTMEYVLKNRLTF
jgi:hypothetical protein